MKKKSTVTVIIAVYNGEKYIEGTIQSILEQTYKNIELIIIDGGSTDGTVDIINKYRESLAYFVTEKDGGISDAFNKGVAVSTGDYINFQGDGDGFWNKDALHNAMQGVKQDDDILVSCRIARISEFGEILYYSKHRKNFYKYSLLFRMSLPHQGLLTHRKYFEQYGKFNIHNKFSMDYEHLLISFKDFPKVKMQNLILAKWRADGLGNNREIEIFKEYDKIKREHKIAPNYILWFINVWILLKYRIKRFLTQ